jgi:hypothetical protein
LKINWQQLFAQKTGLKGIKMKTDYEMYRGKCKEMSEELVKSNPELTLVRGYYYCPMIGKQAHWWVKDKAGKIIDPTVKQFPTKGIAAVYEEFDGWCECEQCGKKIKEENAILMGRYATCSDKCARLLVGI